MLSIEEVKLLIEKLKALKGTDFQKLIDDNLKTLQEFAYSVDAYNTRQIARLDKTRNWFQQDLDWRESHQDSILDQLLDKQIELKINQFGKMGNDLQNCLEIGPGNGRHVLALRAWRLMFFTEVLASCKDSIPQIELPVQTYPTTVVILCSVGTHFHSLHKNTLLNI
jgi:hypothetical protein